MNRKERIKNALLGVFLADSLAMPGHWFYKRDKLQEQFDGGLRSLVAPPHPHPESFMVGMSYEPDVENAQRLGRAYDILGEHARFYKTSYSDFEFEQTEQEAAHGNAVVPLEERYHYHHGLKAGDNTRGAQLVRVLLRSISENKGYHPNHFLDSFVDFMTGSECRDPYTEIYLRRWFEAYSQGRRPEDCAEEQRVVWSIGSQGGLIRPLVLSMLFDDPQQALGAAVSHAYLTHRSQNVVTALGVLVPLLHRLLTSESPERVVKDETAKLRLAKVHGDELFKIYREHDGPGNIDRETTWRLHTDWEDSPFRIDDWASRSREEVASRMGTACYTEQGVPLLLTLALKNRFEPRATLVDDANCGGDNVHRGMISGLLLGAAGGLFPGEWLEALRDKEVIETEIDAVRF